MKQPGNEKGTVGGEEMNKMEHQETEPVRLLNDTTSREWPFG